MKVAEFEQFVQDERLREARIRFHNVTDLHGVPRAKLPCPDTRRRRVLVNREMDQLVIGAMEGLLALGIPKQGGDPAGDLGQRAEIDTGRTGHIRGPDLSDHCVE